MYNYPLLASKQTSARIDFLRQGERLVDEKGTHNVKIFTENRTKVNVQPSVYLFATMCFLVCRFCLRCCHAYSKVYIRLVQGADTRCFSVCSGTVCNGE